MAAPIPQAQFLRQFLDEDARVAAATEPPFGPHPSHSPAFEDAAFADQEAVDTLISNCVSLEESAFDHATAIVRGLSEPVQVYSLFTCARAVLECCSAALWIIDGESAPIERIRRSLLLRYRNVDEQRKLAARRGDATTAAVAAERLRNIVIRASTLTSRADMGDPPRILGASPGATEIISIVFGAEDDYRILSGAAHGLPSYLRQLGMRHVGQDVRILEKNLSPQAIELVTLGPLRWFARLTYALRVYRGLDTANLAAAARMAYLQFGIDPEPWTGEGAP